MRQRIPDPTSGRSLVDLNFWGRSKFGAIFVESGKFSDRRLVEITVHRNRRDTKLQNPQEPGNSAGDLFGMVSLRDLLERLLVTSNDRGSKGHGLNHLEIAA